MSDIDDPIRTQLALLADEMPERDLSDDVVRRARRTRRRRTLTAVGGTVVAVAGLLAAVLLFPRGSDLPHPPAGSPSPDAGFPVLPSQFDPAEYQVPAPVLVGYAGPAPPPHLRNCALSTITGIAHTIRTADGVLGVARVRSRNCWLPEYQVVALLDADGHPLSVPLMLSSTPENPRPDIALYTSNAAWGFAWRGSWCGDPAAFVELREQSADLVDRQPLRVPLTGPVPSCQDGQPDSTLVPGVYGSSTQPVEPAPESWKRLTATLQLPSATGETALTGMAVTLRNNTDTAIALSPCPQYSLAVTSSVDEHAVQAPLDCGGTAAVVPAHGEQRFSLAAESFGDYGTAQAGSTVTAEFAMANVSSVTSQTNVRP